MQSDPIGLHGGINTYAYAEGSPLRSIDFYGLAPSKTCVTACVVGGAGIGGAAGTLVGGAGGAVGGGFVGSVAGPGGTVVGGVAGAQAGASSLGPLGALAGGALGGLLASAVCPDEEGCQKRLELDEGLCQALAIQWGKAGVAVCKRSAVVRYGECLRFGVKGIRTPLHGVDTPL